MTAFFRSFSLALLIGLLFSPALIAQEYDVNVNLLDGTVVEGKLLRINAAGVDINPGGGVRLRFISAERIRSVHVPSIPAVIYYPLDARSLPDELRNYEGSPDGGSARQSPFSGNTMSLTLFGGVSLPQGDFGANDKQKAGYALTGFCVGLEGATPLSQEISLKGSFLISLNAMDEDEMKNQLGSGWGVSAGSYLTSWGLVGAEFAIPAGPSSKVYAEAQAGLLFSSFPDITLSYGNASVKQTTKTATAFALGFGGGIRFDKVAMGIRYFSAEPEYEQSAMSSSTKVKLPAALLLLTLGINL